MRFFQPGVVRRQLQIQIYPIDIVFQERIALFLFQWTWFHLRPYMSLVKTDLRVHQNVLAHKPTQDWMVTSQL